MNLLLSSTILLATFSASTLTTFFLCYFYKSPFFNPTYNRYQFYINIKRVIPTTVGVLTQSIIIYSFIVDKFIDNKPHSFVHTVDNILRYSVIVEFIYYIYHRIIHTKKYYKYIHSTHHKNIAIYPFDTFYMTGIDSFFLVLSLGAPFLFLRMNYLENIVSMYIYITAAYLEHSSMFLSHHVKHHNLLFCNFCILNPIFDILVGTYK